MEATRQLRKMSQAERYKRRHDLLRTIPGIGIITTMCILTEICDVKRFRNENQFAAYLGLIPTSPILCCIIIHRLCLFFSRPKRNCGIVMK